jgi:hypothetical protein
VCSFMYSLRSSLSLPTRSAYSSPRPSRS